MKHTKTSTARCDLVVVRISDSSNIKDLAKKIKETGAAHTEIPGCRRLTELGVTPLLRPESVGAMLKTSPGFRGVVYRLPGYRTMVLLALGSATKVNVGEDDNAFVELLGDALTTHRVDNLWVADFSRLLRSIDFLSPTWKVVRLGCDRVRHGGAVIDTDSPTAEVQFLFEALSAAADARVNVKRFTTGRMRAYVDGRCPLPAQVIPFGYRRDKDKRLTLDPNVPRSVVARIVEVLGRPDLTDGQRVAEVRAATEQARSGGRGRVHRLHQAANPSSNVHAWYRLIDVWQHGQWVIDFDLPNILDTVRWNLPVDIREEAHGRVWRMTYAVPLPEGGWATEADFQAAIELRDRRQRRATPTGGTAAGTVRKPLLGLPAWVDDAHQYALLSGRRGVYHLRRRPLSEAHTLKRIGGVARRVPVGWGRGSKKAGELVATIRAADLHAAVAEQLVEGATTGLPITDVPAGLIDGTTSEVIEELRVELEAARRRHRNARNNANDAQSEVDRQSYLEDASQARHEVERLQHELLALAQHSGDGDLPVDADTVAKALAGLADAADHVPGEVADALRTILGDFRLAPISEDRAVVRSSLRIPMFAGVVTIGPTTGTIKLGTRSGRHSRRIAPLAECGDEAARLMMVDGLSGSQAADALGLQTPRRVEQAARDHLATLGLSKASRTTLLSHGTPEARLVVWNRLHGRPFPPNSDRAFAQLIEDCYIRGEAKLAWRTVLSAQQLDRLIRELLNNGGSLAMGEATALAERLGMSPTTLRYLCIGRTRHGLFHPPSLGRDDDQVEVLPCPWDGCGGWATAVSHLPEVAGRVLCPDCRREPDLGRTARFPASYMAGPPSP